MSQHSNILLSVIICSRNRAHEIVNCLPGIAEQAKHFPDVEVIVVDNGSTDNTKEVVAQFSSKLQYPFRYIYEPIAGLCQARNRGREEAKGNVLAYLDDDALLKTSWIERVRDHFLQQKSDCLGGKVSIDLGGQMPFRFDNSMMWFFMASNMGEQARPLTHPEHPIGCNMAFTTHVFDTIGGFNTNLKLYGDETDFFRRVYERDFSVYYDPAVEVSQFIPAERLTIEELKDKSYKWGKGSATHWLLKTNSGVKRSVKLAEFMTRTVYMGFMSKLRGNFGGFYTYWYNRGYLAQLIKGLEDKRNTR
ncbi:MAG TPA: glycosyltransferase family A protein [Chitinophagaceae bacterium]